MQSVSLSFSLFLVPILFPPALYGVAELPSGPPESDSRPPRIVHSFGALLPHCCLGRRKEGVFLILTRETTNDKTNSLVKDHPGRSQRRPPKPRLEIIISPPPIMFSLKTALLALAAAAFVSAEYTIDPDSVSPTTRSRLLKPLTPSPEDG